MAGSFKGGVHPNDFKTKTNSKPIEAAPIPKIVRIPMSQHLGAPCKPVVQKGDFVKKGQVVGEASGFVSAPVHSSVSGKVVDVIPYPHIFGTTVPCAIIENDNQEEWAPNTNQECADVNTLSVDEIKNRIKSAGIVGMGGATFPCHVKISPPPGKTITSFILNGCECEPYLTSDHRLMLEKPDEIIQGMLLLCKTIGVKNKYIGIESNKPDAVKIMRETAAKYDNSIKVVNLHMKYPQGAEKQLIKAVINREVPSGGLPMDVGALVHNVGTAYAVYEAVKYQRPCIERIVTITGDGVQNPKNLLARVGITVAELLEFCGVKDTTNKLILGGPMMGLAQFTDEVVVTKGTSGILVLTDAKAEKYYPCIRCGRCVDACPMGLVPSTISILGEADNIDEAKTNNVLDCIECGCCAYVCPSKRPIVQFVKYCKSELRIKDLKEKVKKEAELKQKTA
ncbi:MAG: electron transport complex subunit RsxC [Planctomycetota bacterium]